MKKSFQFKFLFSHQGDVLLTWLHESSIGISHMIRGIGGFITKRIPELCRRWLGEFYDLAVYLGRLGYQLGKLLGLVATWLAILIAPLIYYPGWITLGWLAMAFAGSVWGLRRYGSKRQLSVAKKEVTNATA